MEILIFDVIRSKCSKPIYRFKISCIVNKKEKEMDKKIKVQLTLPSSLVDKIVQETNENYMNKSKWIEMVVRFYFNYKEKKGNRKKIDLDI